MIFRPYLILLYVCLLYLAFPSNHFNADGLHYNLLAFHSVADPSALLRDESVPVHLLWHLLATGILAVVRPSTPEQSLYLLRLMNVLLALGSLFLLMRIVGSYASEWVTSWALVMVAFSQACLRYFLSVEVYSLNNLILAIVLLAVFRVTRGPAGQMRARDLIALGLLSALAIAAHLGNFLLVIPILFVIARPGPREGLRAGLIFVLTLAAGILVPFLGIAFAGGIDLQSASRLILRYSGKTNSYLSSGMIQSSWEALNALAGSMVSRIGLWLYLPALAFLLFAFSRWRRLRGRPWLSFLAVYVIVLLAFISQWDPTNPEHKIALIPPLILLVTSTYVAIGEPRPRAFAAGAFLLAAGAAILGVTDAVLPYIHLQDYPPYLLASAIHDQSEAANVLLVGPAPDLARRTVVLASMTFYGQRVALLTADEPDLDGKIRGRREEGFDVLWMKDGRPAREPRPAS